MSGNGASWSSTTRRGTNSSWLLLKRRQLWMPNNAVLVFMAQDVLEVNFKKTAAAETQYSTGAQRDNRVGKGAFHWMPWDALFCVSRIYELGNKGRSKTGDGNDRNWENGMPILDLCPVRHQPPHRVHLRRPHRSTSSASRLEHPECHPDVDLGASRIPPESTQHACPIIEPTGVPATSRPARSPRRKSSGLSSRA